MSKRQEEIQALLARIPDKTETRAGGPVIYTTLRWK